MTRGVHQFLATFEPGAIGEHAIAVQATLRERGIESEIYFQYAKADYEAKGRLHTAYLNHARDDDTVMYHMAIGSDVADWLMDVPQKLIVAHHNITPVEYYQPWDPGPTYGMAWGRDQLRKLASRAALGLGMSEYNRRELEALHYAKTAVAPIILDVAARDAQVDESFLDQLRQNKADGSSDWLFVGWVAPHKCQHDIIRAFAAYRALYDHRARLHLVGRVGEQNYFDACEKLIAELGLSDAAFLHGRVGDGQLAAFYRSADALVCMSEHEGVGLPLLEAMHHNLPIVAFAAAAIPETVGNAGLVLPKKKPAIVAAAAHRVITDGSLKANLIARGRAQVDRFSPSRAAERLFAALEMVSTDR